MPRPAANIHIAAQRVKENANALEQSASGERHTEVASLVGGIVGDCMKILASMGDIEAHASTAESWRERCAAACIDAQQFTKRTDDKDQQQEQGKGRVATNPPDQK